jgi:hypothetical protein
MLKLLQFVGWLFWVALFVVLALAAYGILIIIFRHAFGVELPHPV